MPEKESSCENLSRYIRDVPDFPVEGIIFKDITTLLKDPQAFRRATELFLQRYRGQKIDQVVAIESRGFIFGAPIAYQLGVGFVPVRKLGKLPADTISQEYALEYGTACLEIHKDAIQKGQRILIVDDLLATGGSAQATVSLVEKLGGEIVSIAFLIELAFLKGRDKLKGHDLFSLIRY